MGSALALPQRSIRRPSRCEISYRLVPYFYGIRRCPHALAVSLQCSASFRCDQNGQLQLAYVSLPGILKDEKEADLTMSQNV